ncbi:MAG: TetR/AcrR family transcriptional regulator, partial [Thermosynechococcaceae cyanobacterium]
MAPLSAHAVSAQQKQAQILQGALQIFLQQGYEGTSMDRVATAAGVSKITIYKHFRDKEGLFTAMIERVTAQRFETVFGSLSLQEPPEIVLRQVAIRLLDMLAVDEEYIAFLRLVIGESGRFPALAQLFIQALPQKVWVLLGQYFETHPELNVSNPEAAARIFMGALISYVMTQKLLHGQEIAPMDPDVFIDSLVELIIKPHPRRNLYQ